MTFNLIVHDSVWQRHLNRYVQAVPEVVPVIKGNGYGLGRIILAQESNRLGVDTLAVGTLAEAVELLPHHSGRLLVLTPLQLSDVAPDNPGSRLHPTDQQRVIRTISTMAVLAEAARNHRQPPFVIELDSPMHRHGLEWNLLPDVRAILPGLQWHGIALHLPPVGARLAAARAALTAVKSADLTPPTVWVSHLDGEDLARLREQFPHLPIRPRVGTALWLGERSALQAQGQVLEVRPTAARDRLGYRQRRAGLRGSVIVVGGGTAHGVGLRSPQGSGWLAGVRAIAAEVVSMVGHPPSPFSWQGRQLAFADVAHMQVSMLLLPHDRTTPAVGQWLDCGVRMTPLTPSNFSETPSMPSVPRSPRTSDDRLATGYAATNQLGASARPANNPVPARIPAS
jgi:hypothetical protein